MASRATRSARPRVLSFTLAAWAAAVLAGGILGLAAGSPEGLALVYGLLVASAAGVGAVQQTLP
jgi:hypothetical protein